MKTTLRPIGDARGVIIPAPLLAECEIKDRIELSVEDGRIIIAPVKAPRAGWFDGYQPENDTDAWEGIADTLTEQDEWEWHPFLMEMFE